MNKKCFDMTIWYELYTKNLCESLKTVKFIVVFYSIVGVLCSFRVGWKSDAWYFSTIIYDGFSYDNKREPATDRKNAPDKYKT